MEPTATAGTTASPTPLPDDPGLPAPGLADLLDGMPRQRGAVALVPAGAAPFPADEPSTAVPVPGRPLPGSRRLPARLRALRPWRLLPTPTGTPFTFAYAALLAVTSRVAADADPGLMHALYQASSTDVAHLVRTPVLALVASALWIAGGLLSAYAICFLLVLTALERRIGGARAAGVFLFGHVLATLATEVPVGIAVLVGHLPESSLHRLDYGISFGVAASTGALAGLLSPWLRWPLLALFGGMVLQDLIAFTDPMTNWGHLIALTIGIATWPLVRRRQTARADRAHA
ncbi:rhomboid-like protein [Streptomyces sp. NPDC086549]|uniref:rhomboid-like protein n=1 Tax=Streptomyces sp. NPDC086549 TaxID=3365752 RepID=UPI00381C0B1B